MHHNRYFDCLLNIRYCKRRVYTTENKEEIEILFQCENFLNELDKTVKDKFFEIDKSFRYEDLIIDILPYEVFIYKSPNETKKNHQHMFPIYKGRENTKLD